MTPPPREMRHPVGHRSCARVRCVLPLALTAIVVAITGCGGDSAPPPGAARGGTQVFVRASCGGCHTMAAADARGRVGPNLDRAQPGFEQVAEQVREGGDGMPSFAGRLSDQEIESVAAYVAERR